MSVPPGGPLTQEDLENSTPVDWVGEKEYWNEYKLADGTTLKIKLVLIGVRRLEKYAPDGEPIYLIQSNNQVRAIGVPSNLKMKPTKPPFNPI